MSSVTSCSDEDWNRGLQIALITADYSFYKAEFIIKVMFVIVLCHLDHIKPWKTRYILSQSEMSFKMERTIIFEITEHKDWQKRLTEVTTTMFLFQYLKIGCLILQVWSGQLPKMGRRTVKMNGWTITPSFRSHLLCTKSCGTPPYWIPLQMSYSVICGVDVRCP